MLSGAAKQNRDIALCITVHVYLIHATGSGIGAYARLRFAKALPAKSGSERKKKATSQKLKPPLKPPVKVLAHPAPYPRTTAASQTALHRQAAGRAKKMRCCVKGYKKAVRENGRRQRRADPGAKQRQSKCVVRKGYKKRCKPEASEANLTIADAHKVRVQKAQSTAMNKLMGQLGKTYRWGGTSPRTGFDCSGLVYYAYKDLVKIHIPRTANEMYHHARCASGGSWLNCRAAI